MTYHERWHEDADTPLTIYVPTPGALSDIAPESGIVGRPADWATIVRKAADAGIDPAWTRRYGAESWKATMKVIGEPDGRIEICYEGNLHGAENLRAYGERVRAAADRLITRYPTVARATVPADALVPIGWYVPRTHELMFTDLETLAGWLKVSNGND